MKKIALLLTAVLVLQLLLGCSGKEEEIVQPVNFYYVNREITFNTAEGVISPEIHEGAEFQNLEDLLRAYLKGPDSAHLQSLLPGGTTLHSCIVEDGSAHIQFSSQFSNLSGVKLTTVCTAILLTAHDYMDVGSISFRSMGAKLDDKDDFILSIDDIVLEDAVTSEEPKE